MNLKELKKKFKKNIKQVMRGNEYGDKITYSQLKNIVKKENAILLDVRSIQEYQEGHLNGAINLPSYEVTNKINQMLLNKNQTIIIYCQTGNRSSTVIKELQTLGYEKVYELEGGLDNI